MRQTITLTMENEKGLSGEEIDELIVRTFELSTNVLAVSVVIDGFYHGQMQSEKLHQPENK